MLLGLVSTFRPDKKEPLALLLERIHGAFRLDGGGPPDVRFTFCDSSIAGGVSSVDRVLKRFPEMERFCSRVEGFLGQDPYRQLTNQAGSTGENEALDFETILRIAEGVPKSFPFHSMAIHFASPPFGVLPAEGRPPLTVLAMGLQPGIAVGDSWWVSGRVRSVAAFAIVEAPAAAKKLPSLPAPVQAVLAVCGKPQKTHQVVLGESEVAPAADGAPTSGEEALPKLTSETLQKIVAVGRDYRERMSAILESNPLPYELPPLAEALAAGPRKSPGEKKPALVAAFQPLGFRIRGGSGEFVLRRRTPANLTVTLTIDVGTWGNHAAASYTVLGPGFSVGVPLPVSVSSVGALQYPAGDAAQWAKIVANFAALTQVLDRTMLPAIEALAGPAPAWFEP